MNNKVAIIGKENSGKSSLFNYLADTRRSLVSKQQGMTRDIITGFWTYSNTTITLMDSNGFSADQLNQCYMSAIESSQVVLFAHSLDQYFDKRELAMLRYLRSINKAIILVLTKSDLHDAGDVVRYKYKHCFTSCRARYGKDTLGNQVLAILGHEVFQPVESPCYKNVVLLGQPNVGKSTFINTACSTTVSFVSPLPGTTTDCVHSKCTIAGIQYNLIDTAGIKKSKDTDERYILAKNCTLAITGRSDACILMVDGTKGLCNQDKKLLNLFFRTKSKPGVVVITKTDLLTPKVKKQLYYDIISIFRCSDIYSICNKRVDQVRRVLVNATKKMQCPIIKVSLLQKWLQGIKTKLSMVKYASLYRGTLMIHGKKSLRSLPASDVSFILNSFTSYFKLYGYSIDIVLR